MGSPPGGGTEGEDLPLQCAECGAPLRERARFCLRCGHVVEEGQADAGRAEPGAEPSPQPADLRPLPAGAMGAAPIPGNGPSPEARSLDALSFDGPIPQQPAQGGGVPYRVALTFSDGSSVLLDSDAVLGRKPEAVAAQEGLVAVPLIDPVKSSSRVHLRLRLRPEGVHVVDAGSGNGTTVEHEGAVYACEPHSAFWIEPGDRLWLGDVPVEVSLG